MLGKSNTDAPADSPSFTERGTKADRLSALCKYFGKLFINLYLEIKNVPQPKKASGKEKTYGRKASPLDKDIEEALRFMGTFYRYLNNSMQENIGKDPMVFMFTMDKKSGEPGIVLIPVISHKGEYKGSEISRYFEESEDIFKFFKKFPSLKQDYREIFDTLRAFLWYSLELFRDKESLVKGFKPQLVIDMLDSINLRPSDELLFRCCEVFLSNEEVQAEISKLQTRGLDIPSGPEDFLQWLYSKETREKHPYLTGKYSKTIEEFANRLAESHKQIMLRDLAKRKADIKQYIRIQSGYQRGGDDVSLAKGKVREKVFGQLGTLPPPPKELPIELTRVFEEEDPIVESIDIVPVLSVREGSRLQVDQNGYKKKDK